MAVSRCPGYMPGGAFGIERRIIQTQREQGLRMRGLMEIEAFIVRLIGFILIHAMEHDVFRIAARTRRLQDIR